MITRVFRAIVHDGMQDDFARFFRETAIPLLESQRGMVGMTVGSPVAQSPNEFLMITTWADLEALKEFAGENWESAVIDPGEAHLLRETYVYHYETW